MTTPAQKLEVNGNARLTTGNALQFAHGSSITQVVQGSTQVPERITSTCPAPRSILATPEARFAHTGTGCVSADHNSDRARALAGRQPRSVPSGLR